MKKISFKNQKSYSYSAAKQIAKRGYELVDYNSLDAVVDSVDQDTLGVLPFGTVDSFGEGDIWDSLRAVAYSDKLVFVDKIVPVVVDYRLFVIKKEHYDYRNIKTIRLTQHAYECCKNNLESNFLQAKLDIVQNNESVFLNMDTHTCAIQGVFGESKELAMGLNTVSDNKQHTINYCVVSTDDTVKKDANRIFFCFDTKDEPGALIEVLQILKRENINIQAINSTREPSNLIFLEIGGNIRQNNITQALTDIGQQTSLYKFLGNI